MTQYNWGWWFVLSTIWLIAMFLLAMIDDGVSKTTGFGFAMAICCINLLGCLYIGNKPGALED